MKNYVLALSILFGSLVTISAEEWLTQAEQKQPYITIIKAWRHGETPANQKKSVSRWRA